MFLSSFIVSLPPPHLSELLIHFGQSAELFAMTYGAIVTQMLKDYEDVEAVNTELDKMYIPMHIFLI